MTRFLLVRHAESQWNAQRRWQGHADPPLTDRGREQARAAAAAIAPFDGPVFSSDLKRARETAEIVAGELGLGPVTTDPDLREIDVGAFSGLTADEVRERLPDAHRAWRAGELDAYPQGESKRDHLTRLLVSFERIATQHAGDVLVVSHGGCLTQLERHLGVHPGRPSTNLTARWFEWDGSLRAVSERLQLAPAAPPERRRVH
ncbi:MAG TPA: histidine phosphatase family protein [Actinomycetota bacterium]|nr:histidine phosphatase family protein [Actinomycetota bacterium]